MKTKFNVCILGDGRIGWGVQYYFRKNKNIARVWFLRKEAELKHADLLVGALAGELGQRCTDLALKYRTNLIDISDVDPPVYLGRKKEIEKRGITVIPGCGFCPGIVNFILGRELSSRKRIMTLEVKAGSLSPQASFYPFLWCFEDLILEHRIPSWQIIKGRKKKFPAFAGYKEEEFFGIKAESYYSASGFENLLEKTDVSTVICRVVRPFGFQTFFSFLENQGVLSKGHFAQAKQILESRREDNMSFSEISITAGGRRDVWLLKSFSRRTEPLNSMQKITASVPALMARFLLEYRLFPPGLLFMEDIAGNEKIFNLLMAGIRKEGITITQSTCHD